MTKEQLIQAFFIELKELVWEELVPLASNTVSNDYYPELARQLWIIEVVKQVSTWASSTSLVDWGHYK